MNILISSCLLGSPCRYNGTGCPVTSVIQELSRRHTLIPVCPELLGGLSVPRAPAELTGYSVKDCDSHDLTEEFLKGARRTLLLAQKHNCTHAVLKEKSPSCGSSLIYDGTFSGTVIPGAGLTAQLLRKYGLVVLSELQTEELSEI